MKESVVQCDTYHSLARQGKSDVTAMALLEPEEDIAAIAKQISDHAEAIYQTWKSRGLAPTEILKCHSSMTAADKFGSTLRPKTAQLERIVNTFVVEDKARRRVQSSIQNAVQKFETRTQPTQISRPVPANPDTVDTIEVIFPEDVVRRDAPASTSWPLKNRAVVRNAGSAQRALDEVAREEERLIAALQAGTVVDDTKKPLQQVVDEVRRPVPMDDGKRAPHPELTAQQKQHLRQGGSSPVRPFLTRGSVAERVLIFEKCPTEILDKRRSAPAVTSWRGSTELQSRAQTYTRTKESQRTNQLPPHTTLQRHTKANKNVLIPRFYFPTGRPPSQAQADAVLQKIAAEFRTFPLGQVPRDKFHVITRACDLPLYWKVPLFLAAGGDKLGFVEARTFLEFWKHFTVNHHDAANRFVRLLVRSESRNYLLPEDFIPLVQDVVDTHPGLTFLKEATEFHSRYVHTVIARIYYCVNRSWSGRITVPELRRSNLLQVIASLEQEEDINQVTQYFSYEHFYVIYCKFWELDLDHDLFICREDLSRHNDHALSTRVIDRIFSGAVTRGGNKPDPDKMSYTEFVWFLLSEEDKQHPTAIEYWFRCMDLDGDGYLSMYELEYFYEEQLRRMEFLGIETLPFEDCLCQMLDMIHPKTEGKIALSDLKRCKMVPIFFDTFFNLEKYLDHEQRDPFASQRDPDDPEMSDWDRFAAEEYEVLVAEEGGAEPSDGFLIDNDDSEVTPVKSEGGTAIIPINIEKPDSTPAEVVRIKVTADPELRVNGWSTPRVRVVDYDAPDIRV